jgi:hypothetical protein
MARELTPSQIKELDISEIARVNPNEKKQSNAFYLCTKEIIPELSHAQIKEALEHPSSFGIPGQENNWLQFISKDQLKELDVSNLTLDQLKFAVRDSSTSGMRTFPDNRGNELTPAQQKAIDEKFPKHDLEFKKF